MWVFMSQGWSEDGALVVSVFAHLHTNPCSRIEMFHQDPRWHVNPVDHHHLHQKPAKKLCSHLEREEKTQSLCLWVAFKRFGEKSQSKFAFRLEL